MERELITQAELARRLGVSKMAVTKWRQRGWISLTDGLVDAVAAMDALRRHRGPEQRHAAAVPRRTDVGPVRVSRAAVLALLEALDGLGVQPGACDAARVQQGAQAVGLVATQDPDTGRFRLCRPNGATAGGAASTMDGPATLEVCRLAVDPPLHDPTAVVSVRLDLLPALARPYLQPESVTAR